MQDGAPDVQAREDVHLVDVDHCALMCVDVCRPQGREPFSCILVVQTCCLGWCLAGWWLDL